MSFFDFFSPFTEGSKNPGLYRHTRVVTSKPSPFSEHLHHNFGKVRDLPLRFRV